MRRGKTYLDEHQQTQIQWWLTWSALRTLFTINHRLLRGIDPDDVVDAMLACQSAANRSMEELLLPESERPADDGDG